MSEFEGIKDTNGKEVLKPKRLIENNIQSISHENLAQKCKELKRAELKLGFKEMGMMMPSFMAIISAMGLIINANTNFAGFIYSIIGLLAFIGWVIFYLKIRSVSKLDKQEKIFFKFYKIYEKVRQYRNRKKHTDSTKYNESMNELYYFIKNWTRNAPSEISTLPESISENLKKYVSPLFEKNVEKDILTFIDQLEMMVYFTYVREPTFQILTDFNYELTLLSNDISQEVPTKEKTSKKYTFLKMVGIAPLSGLIIYLAFNSTWQNKGFESAEIGLTSSILIFFGIIGFTQKKPF